MTLFLGSETVRFCESVDMQHATHQRKLQLSSVIDMITQLGVRSELNPKHHPSFTLNNNSREPEKLRFDQARSYLSVIWINHFVCRYRAHNNSRGDSDYGLKRHSFVHLNVKYYLSHTGSYRYLYASKYIRQGR